MKSREELFRCFPEGPDWDTDWEGVERHFCIQKFAEGMRGTPQDPVWHGEGDVWTHTKMVCEALSAMEAFRALPRRQRQELFLAALLHDAGKIRCTRVEDGRLRAPRHGVAGAHMARELLWRELGMAGTPELQNFRETVCTLIRYHMEPIHLGENEDRRKLIRIAAAGELAGDFQLSLLCLLSRADAVGRLAEDTAELAERAAFTEILAEELGCLEGPKAFSSPYAQRAYLKGKLAWPEGELYDDTWGEVRLKKILDEHPQAFMLNGHNHNELSTYRVTYFASTEQHNNIVQTGGTAYIGDEFSTTSDSHQGWLVYVYEGEVIFRGRDFVKGEWLPGSFLRFVL